MAYYITAIITLEESDMLPCLSKQILGMECPGCGIQRSIALLLKGEFLNSFLMYPGLFPMLLLFAFAAINHFMNFRNGSKITGILGGITVFFILLNFIYNLFH